ncbi:MAG: hypothetical protein KC912_17365 [Proteobacteria bacterium]|nr:hypothetical protein [Pseudomonadota bacterium]
MPHEKDPTDEEVKAEEAEEAEAEAAAEAAGEDDASLPHEDEEEGDERGIFGRFTRKLRDRRELTDDAWKAVGAVISTSDRAKSDFIRMMGREVRHYLDGLKLTDDFRELITNHSLEVHASLHLKPLVSEPEPPPEEPEEEPEPA